MDDFFNDVVKALKCAAQSWECCDSMATRLGCKEGGCPFSQTRYCTGLTDIGFTVLLEDAADIISGKYGRINND